MRAIDTFVNVDMGSMEKPDYLIRVAQDYFKRPEEMFRDFTPDELLEIMNGAGVERAVLTMQSHAPNPKVIEFAERHPERFALSVHLDPRRGMAAVRELESLVRNQPVVLARVVPFMYDLPPDNRAYYPVYAKCVELDLPISVNTGIPGPPAPGRCQDPIFLDEVCLFFPELKLVMAHGADPWWSTAIRLMLKYRNLYLMTSAFAPKYLPQELLHYMNTRGKRKILFATDHPVLAMDSCVSQAKGLDLREGVLERYLYDNAWDVLFAGRVD